MSRGILKQKRLPFCAPLDSALIIPQLDSTMFLEIINPSPIPSSFIFAVRCIFPNRRHRLRCIFPNGAFACDAYVPPHWEARPDASQVWRLRFSDYTRRPQQLLEVLLRLRSPAISHTRQWAAQRSKRGVVSGHPMVRQQLRGHLSPRVQNCTECMLSCTQWHGASSCECPAEQHR